MGRAKTMKKQIGWLYCYFFFLLNSPQIAADPSQPTVAKKGMVVSEQHLATHIGADILKAGGNAIDAAVAVGYALAVVNPCCGNIGGGGFITLRLVNGKNIFINFRERAPLAAKTDMFLDKNGKLIPHLSTTGYLSVAVPGTVLGLETALKKYGTMSRQQVMAPAIALAEHGYILTDGDVKLLDMETNRFEDQANIAAIFLNKDGEPYETGDKLVQTDLANTLKLISKNGADAFYKGKIATAIVDASKANNGILSLKDFSDYRVEELTPVTCNFRGYTLISAPPPSSGGTTLCEMLNILENYPLKSLGFHSAQATHYIVEAMRYAYFDRNNQLGDPDYVSNPVTRLISKDYAARIIQDILDVRATPSNELGKNSVPHEGVNTTHYSVVDKWGNAVSVTYTLNSFFGARVIAGNTGFFLNNEMDDFSVKPGDKNQFGLVQGEKNKILPGKRPLSSMTPTIVTKDNKVILILGSVGGPRIITGTLETILNVLVYNMNIQQSVDAPRFHHQWMPDSIDMEPSAFSDDTMQSLSDMGYHFTLQKRWGVVEAIYIDPASKLIYGANDMRRSAGSAEGY